MKKLQGNPQSQLAPSPAEGGVRVEALLVGSLASELKLSFLVREHEYLSDMIKFADQKAAFVVAFAIGAMTMGYTFHLYDALANRPFAWALENLLRSSGLVLALIALLLSFATLLPRLFSHKSQGLMYFNHLLKYQSHSAYASRVLETDETELLTEVATHCYTLAAVARRKFACTNWALWTGGVGAILTLAAVAGTSASPSPALVEASVTSVDRAAAALIAALDLELPPSALSERVANLGAELNSIGPTSGSDQYGNDLKRFSAAYSTAVQLVTALNRGLLSDIATPPRVASHGPEPPPPTGTLTQMRRNTQHLLVEAHTGFWQTRSKH